MEGGVCKSSTGMRERRRYAIRVVSEFLKKKTPTDLKLEFLIQAIIPFPLSFLDFVSSDGFLPFDWRILAKVCITGMNIYYGRLFILKDINTKLLEINKIMCP